MTIMAAHGQPIVNLARTTDGFHVEGASGESLRPMFLSDAALATADALRALMPYSPPEILSMNWYDRARAFAAGRTALAYSHTLLANLFERDSASAAYRKIGYAPHPTGPAGWPISVLGGYGLSIPANIAPERVPAVWEALLALTSASAAKLYILNGSLASPRFSVNRDPEVAAVSPVIGVVDQMARDGILRMWPRPPVPGISTVIRVAGEEVHDMLLGLKTPEAALADAQNRTDALLQERGVY
jgi:multiple sugar transport system substrate-binding protein